MAEAPSNSSRPSKNALPHHGVNGSYGPMFALGMALLIMSAPQSVGAEPPCARALTDSDLAQPVTEQERRAVVEALARMSERLYVDPANGMRLAAALRSKQAAGALRHLTDAGTFAATLTAELQSTVPDKHLKVRHRRIEPSPAATTATAGEKVARMDRFRRSAAYDGHGIKEVSILPGNVGYLNLGEFWSPDVSRTALEAAMAVLKEGDALIIDLRGSYGGHEDVLALIMGYLLPVPVPLFTSVDRVEGKSRVGMSEARNAQQRLDSRVPVYVLTSKRRTFSAAEALALALKRKRGATLVGEKTRGGANGGDFRPLSCRFDAFIPYFGSTVDGISWEGVGIAPDVAVVETRALDEAYRLALAKLVEAPLPEDADGLAREIRDERIEMLVKAKAK